MKISFITDEATQSPELFIALANKYNITEVELRTVNDKHLIDFSKPELAALKNQLEENNLGVCCLGSPVYKCDIDANIQDEIDKLHRSIDVAQYLDIPIIRIFTFWRRPDRAQYEHRIIKYLEQAEEVVKGSGILLGIENGKRSMHSTGEELQKLFEHLNTDIFKIVWDPGNSIYGGTDFDPIKNGYPRIKENVIHIHIKDPQVYSSSERKYVEIGAGQLQLAEQIKNLRSDKYPGFLSLETHWRPNKKFTEHQLDYPGGNKFSSSGYEATDSSLAILNDLIINV